MSDASSGIVCARDNYDPSAMIDIKEKNSYAATLIAGNKDDLDDSDHLSSRSVLTHCTALYVY